MEISFTHIVLEGSPYEVGKQQGEELKKDKQRANYLTPTLPFLDGYSEREAQRALTYIEKHCPGLREEIQGAADGFGVPVEEIAFLGGKGKKNGSSPIPVSEPASRTSQPGGSSHCSQLVVLPGVCLHHYSEGMGTLWSTIFDVTAMAVDVCFGAPSSEKNPWRSFGLRDPIGITQYQAHLPDEAPNPGFWERMPSGSDG